MIFCSCTCLSTTQASFKGARLYLYVLSESGDMSECIHYECVHPIIQQHMVKDKKLILTMRTENRWLSVSQPHSANRYDSSELRGPIKPDRLWQTQHVVTVLRLSEEIHVILNRFYIAWVIIFLFDFTDSALGQSSDRRRGAVFAHKGANSLQYLLRCWTVDVGWVMNKVHCSYSNSTFVLYVWQQWQDCLLKFATHLQSSLLFKQGFKAELIFYFLTRMPVFPFTSEINFPPWYTNLAVSSPSQWFFSFLFLLEAGNEHRRFCPLLWWGLRPPS